VRTYGKISLVAGATVANPPTGTVFRWSPEHRAAGDRRRHRDRTVVVRSAMSKEFGIQGLTAQGLSEMNSRLFSIVLLSILVGCSGPASTKSSPGDATTQASSTNDGVSASSSDGPSPVVDATSIAVDSPPETICRIFIDYLRLGENSKAEKLMTQEAISQTRKLELDLAAPAGPDANYAVGHAEFATNQQRIAFVPVVVTEGGDSSDMQSFSMMLKFGDFGWKIAGIYLGAHSETQDLLSFENPQDVQRIKSMLESESHQEQAMASEKDHRLR
jgi:hypothetical protein